MRWCLWFQHLNEDMLPTQLQLQEHRHPGSAICQQNDSLAAYPNPAHFHWKSPEKKTMSNPQGKKENPGFLGLVEGWGWRTLIGWTHSGHPALLFSGWKISFKVWKRICSWLMAKSRLFWVSLWFPLSQQNVPAELHGGKKVTKIKRILNKTNIRQIWLLR